MKVQKFENLERGNILRLLIDSFNQDKIEASLCDVLTCLWDSFVLILCSVQVDKVVKKKQKPKQRNSAKRYQWKRKSLTKSTEYCYLNIHYNHHYDETIYRFNYFMFATWIYIALMLLF